MRHLLVLVALTLLGPLCSAEVNRCTDAAGQVSYTDAKCPASTKVTRLALPEPMVVNRGDSDAVPRPAEPRPAVPTPAAAAPPPQAAAPAPQPPPAPVIGSYGGDPVVTDYGYPYGGYRPAPPRNMGPRMRNCNAAGCDDTQGNHYDRTGTLNRYKSLDGRTCTPVGTTVVCR